MLCENKSPRERAWGEMLKRDVFTTKEVADAVQIEHKLVGYFVQFLMRKGVLNIVQPKRPYLFKVNEKAEMKFGKGQRNDRAVTSRRLSKPRKRMWSTMRVIRKFTVLDLVKASGVSRNAAHSYIQHLVSAGYVRKIFTGGTKKGEFAVYLLARNTGPESPIDKGKNGMWDVNELRLYPKVGKGNSK